MTAKQSISPAHRYPSGEILKDQQEPKKETREQVMALARWQREKLGATADNFDMRFWGSHLGMMRSWAVEAQSNSEGLSRQQHMAIEIYIADRHRARIAQGFPRDTAKAMVLDDTPVGGYSDDEVDEDEIYRLRRTHNAARSACLQYLDRGNWWLNLLDSLARNEHTTPYWRAALGEVRSAANILVKHYGIK